MHHCISFKFKGYLSQYSDWLQVRQPVASHFPARAHIVSSPLHPDWLWDPSGLLCNAD